MYCAAQTDPVSAIVLHSAPGDLEYVIVDGVVRKKDGKLSTVTFEEGREWWVQEGENRDSVEWREVATELLKRREGIQIKFDTIDWEEARKGVIEGFHIDDKKIVDSV